MKKLIPIILISILSCNNKPATEKIADDLFFSFFRVGNYYNKPDSEIKMYEAYFDTLRYETADKEEGKLLTKYKKLKQENLLNTPFVDILIDKDSMVSLYLGKADYDKIKKYKRAKLQAEHKKIRVEADVSKISDGLYLCAELREVKMIEGETLGNSPKLKIQDYE